MYSGTVYSHDTIASGEGQGPLSSSQGGCAHAEGRDEHDHVNPGSRAHGAYGIAQGRREPFQVGDSGENVVSTVVTESDSELQADVDVNVGYRICR